MKKVNVNADFLLDIWADIKARRLAPVAVGLLVALVAMPVLLMKGEEGATDEPLPILAATSTQNAEVEVAEELADRDSKLDSYKARDPFKGRVKPGGDAPAGSGAASAPADALGEPKGGGGGGSTPSLGDLGAPSGGDPLGGGDDSDDSQGAPPAPTPTPPPAVQVPRRYRYNYQLDLRFGRPGREERYPAVTRLSFLPSPKIPALLFMGVPVHERSALFFVHPGLTHQGEGSCVPSKKHCNFLELKVGEQHYLSTDDLEFGIELLKIKQVRLSQEKEQRAQARKASSGRRSARSYAEGAAPGTDVTAGEAADEAVEFPWLVDGIG